LLILLANKKKLNTDNTVEQSIQTQYENVNFTPPENILWIRFTVLPGDSGQKTTGAPGVNTTRHVGVAIAEVFSPLGKGDKDVYDTIAFIKAAFDPGTYAGVLYRTGKYFNQGRVGAHYKINFTIPYQADELV